MTPNSVRTLWPLLAAAGALALVGIAVLWQLRTLEQVCIAIYPAPPGCGATEHHWAALVGIGLIVAVFAAIVVARFTMSDPVVTMIVLLGVMVLIIVAALAVVGVAQSGMWNTPMPIDPLIIE